MLSSNKTPAVNTESMARLQFYDPKLYHRVLQFEWAILIICAIGEGIAFRYGPQDITAPNLGVSLILLALFSIVSGFVPVREPYWDRFCYLLLQLELVTGATAAGLARFIFPLFMIIVAKSCLLLDKRGIRAFQIMTCFAQIGYSCYKLSLKNPQMFTHEITPLSALLILGQALVYCYVAIALVILVAMLTQSLVGERKSRMETERLSNEVQNLATELERTRIAREIHDSLGHTLTSLNIQLDIARKLRLREPERATSSLEMAKELASQSLNDVRMAIHHIRTSSDFDFKVAVSGLVTDVQQMHNGMEVRLDIKNVDNIPASIGFQVFRVIQECLTNVMRHANASQVIIEVEQIDEVLRLKVCDNGIGGNTELMEAGGFGLKGMQERIATLNGSLSIETQQQKGTQISAVIPLKTIGLELSG